MLLIYEYGRKDLGKGTLINFTDGGEGTPGIKRSQEYILKLSERQKGEKGYLVWKKITQKNNTKDE